MAVSQYQVSRDAAAALHEFSEEMSEALVLGEITPWATDFGFTRTTDAPKTTFPIPLHALKYQEYSGDMKYQSLYHRSLSMIGKEWQAGVEEKASIIEAPDFIDWAGAPAVLAQEWLRLPNEVVAGLLAQDTGNGPVLNFYRDADSGVQENRRMFAADHPYNVLKTSLGTFDNTHECTEAEIADGTVYKELNAKFRAMKGPNGKNLGLQFLNGGRILNPAALENNFFESLKQDTVVRVLTEGVTTQKNLYTGISNTTADELTRDADFYAFAPKRNGLHSWVVQTQGSPEERIFDKSSEFYRNTNRVKVAYIGSMNAAMALPHGVIRVRVTG